LKFEIANVKKRLGGNTPPAGGGIVSGLTAAGAASGAPSKAKAKADPSPLKGVQDDNVLTFSANCEGVP
jgi:hypothetical protein